mgnify:CR=1 FL=1
MTKPGARNKCGAVIPFRPSPGPYAMPNFTAPIPLAVYVHLPWCVRKCPYCDFNSHAVREEGLPEALIAPLAFLGPDFDCALQTEYTTVTNDDIYTRRRSIRWGGCSAPPKPSVR